MSDFFHITVLFETLRSFLKHRTERLSPSSPNRYDSNATASDSSDDGDDSEDEGAKKKKAKKARVVKEKKERKPRKEVGEQREWGKNIWHRDALRLENRDSSFEQLELLTFHSPFFSLFL